MDARSWNRRSPSAFMQAPSRPTGALVTAPQHTPRCWGRICLAIFTDDVCLINVRVLKQSEHPFDASNPLIRDVPQHQ